MSKKSTCRVIFYLCSQKLSTQIVQIYFDKTNISAILSIGNILNILSIFVILKIFCILNISDILSIFNISDILD